MSENCLIVTVILTVLLTAVVVLSVDAAIESVAKAFEGQAMELIRSDLSVQQEDALRAAFSAGH